MCKNKALILEGFSPNQCAAAETTGRGVLVRAGAGSGKTKTLVAHYLLLLDENREWHPSDITAVTFTRKAAREMQNRIRQEMMKLVLNAGDDPDEKRFWMEMLKEMDSANIGTIHSLCGRILRAHPAEAGLDPAFSVLDDNNAAMLTGQVVEEIISKISADPEYEALLNFYDGNKLSRILSDLLKNRSKTDAAMSVPGMKTGLFLKKQAGSFLFDSEYSDYMAEYRALTQSADFMKKTGSFGEHLLDLIQGYDLACSAFNTEMHPADCIELFHAPFNGWILKGRADRYDVNAKKIREDLRSVFPFLKPDDKKRDAAWYKDFWEQYDAAEECLRKLWLQVRNAYMNLVDASQTIDFDSMESLTLELLRNNREIRENWQRQVKTLLVDEFQDTNEAQTELFSLLDPFHDRLFAVGDKKQSIYGFRGTNVALFERRAEEMERYKGENILLDITYRTDAELLTPMGSLLESVMEDDELRDKDFYAAYEAMRTPDRTNKTEDLLPNVQPRTEILLSDVKDKADDPDGKINGYMLAKRLTELMAQGALCTWNDAVILCRNSNDFKQFEDALGDWHIPYVTVAGKGYYDRPEIREVLNILRAAENPDDNAVFTGFLMSPSVGFTAEMVVRLYRFANKGGLKMSFRQAFFHEDFHFEAESKQQKLERARSISRELIRISGQVPLDEVLEEAYRITGIRTVLAFDKNDRAWLNLDKLLLAARESGMTSVSEFVDYLEKIKETGIREGEAPSDNNGAVRIMTIHQAKGLEFPVTIIVGDDFKSHSPQFLTDENGSAVFLCSPAHPRYTEAKKFSDLRDRAEWLRLFYVAATRAEKMLILCGKMPDFEGKKDGWLKRLLSDFKEEWFEEGVHVGSAWGLEGDVLRLWCASTLPDKPENAEGSAGQEIIVNDDISLLEPLDAKEAEPRPPEHTAALTVGKLVHKGMEMWRFPVEGTSDPLLEEAFHRILMRSDRLDREEQGAVVEKAKMLLSRFRKSDAFSRINSARQRWHELPFSYSGKDHVVNGIIDLLCQDSNGFTVIDFKTDYLDSFEKLKEAVAEHSIQLNKYRRALNITLGEDPRCYICFLDYCGEVSLEPVGRDGPELEAEGPDVEELPPYEDEEDEYWTENDRGSGGASEPDY